MGAKDEQNWDDLIKNEYFFLRSIVHRMCETYNKAELIDLNSRSISHLNRITSLNMKRIDDEIDGRAEE